MFSIVWQKNTCVLIERVPYFLCLPQIPSWFLSSCINSYWFPLLHIAAQGTKAVRESVKFPSPTWAHYISSHRERVKFSLLGGWLPPSLAISRRVIPVAGRHSHNWQIYCAVPAPPPKSLPWAAMRSGASHPAGSWLQKAPMGKSKWRWSSATALPLQNGVLQHQAGSLDGLLQASGNLRKESKVWNRRR